MIQTYKFSSSSTNKSKLDSIRSIGIAYKNYYNKLIKHTITNFYRHEGKIPRFLTQLNFREDFSERYKQTCGKQVKSNLTSWLSNIKNRIREKISGSTLSEDEKIALYTINKYGSWFKKKMIIKDKEVPQDLLKLSRKLFHHCRGKYPKLRNPAMNLDEKIAQVERSENSYDYWIKLSTLEKGCPIFLPIKSYDYFEAKKGLLKKQIQIIIRPDKIEYGLVKDVTFEQIIPVKNKIIGIDTGAVIPTSSSSGNQYGLSLLNRLKRLDAQISKLVKARMKNGLYKKSSALNGLYNKARNLLKNEVGRITNNFLKNEKPEEIVLENNKDIFEGLENFSRPMKRIIKGSGITRIRDLLIIKGEKVGSKVTLINQAYTSQECPICHHIDKKNRKTQATFTCVRCGFTRNADYVGSLNIRNRRSIPSINIYTPYKKIRGLLEIYYESLYNKSCVVLQT
jgi:putative transposase